MIVEIYYTGKHMANIHVLDGTDIDVALEIAFRRTQNIEGSWSVNSAFYPDGTENRDYNPAVEVVEPLVEHNGRTYGHRSSMMGDLFVIDGVGYKVDFIGFTEVE